MKITITQEFNTVEDAAAFIERISADYVIDPASIGAEAVALVEANRAPRTRKPRADAGQKREPYGPRTTTTGEPVVSERGNTAKGTPADGTPPAPATPTKSTAPAEPVSTPQASAGSAKVAEPVAVDFPATLEGARAALKKLHDAPGKGMDACMAALKANGVGRVSDLKPAQFVDFIKYVLDQIPAAKK